MSMSAVAREAGLSVSTVSRFIRGELRINAETEARIRAAMETVGYEQPHVRTRTVGLIVPDLANPYFSQLVQVIADVARGRGMEMLVLVSGGLEHREDELVRRCAASSEVDGVVLISMTGSTAVLAHRPARLPLVVLDERVEESGSETCPYVGADNFEGAYQATTFLLARGHRRIAHAAGPAGLVSARDRMRGYREALADAGVHVDPALVLEGPYSEAFGASALPQLMRRAERPTAVFAASDIVAIGIAAAAPMVGVRIPEDLSLIGFDGIDVGAWLTPRLTTVVQPLAELARGALDALEAESGASGAGSLLVPMQVRIAESVARPANA